MLLFISYQALSASVLNGRVCPNHLSKNYQGHKMERMQLGASRAFTLSFLCTCFIGSWKLSLITSPSKTKSWVDVCFTTSAISSQMCPKLRTAYHFLENCSTLPSVLTMEITLTPSSLTSNIFLPNTFFSCFAGIMCR